MHQRIRIQTASLIIALVFSISLACWLAAPSNVDMPTGDLSSPEAEHIHLLPQGTTTRGGAEDWEAPSWTLSPCRNAMTPQEKYTPLSPLNKCNSVHAPRAILSGKHRQYAHVLGAVGRRHCLRHCGSHPVRRAHCAVDVWRPESGIGAWCL